MLMFLFFFVMVCGLFVWKCCCTFLCFIVRIDVGDPIIKRLRFTLTCITPPHFHACPKPWHGFPMSYVICHGPFIIVQCLEEVVYFVDIGRIVDHHLFKFHFIILRIFIRLSTNRLQFNQVFINNKQSDIWYQVSKINNIEQNWFIFNTDQINFYLYLNF